MSLEATISGIKTKRVGETTLIDDEKSYVVVGVAKIDPDAAHVVIGGTYDHCSAYVERNASPDNFERYYVAEVLVDELGVPLRDEPSIVTTELDAALDIASALEMYAGTFGSESTTISEDGARGEVFVTLDNGDQFKIVITKTNTRGAAVQS